MDEMNFKISNNETEVYADILVTVSKMSPENRRNWLLVGKGIVIGAGIAKKKEADNNAETDKDTR